MEVSDKCNINVKGEDRYEYLIEYRGDLLKDLEKIDYACGYIINEKFAIISVIGNRIDELVKEIPSILFVSFRSIFVLESTVVNDVSNIRPIKINPNLNLTGSGVLIGIVDTGIDYMNKEFIREDDTSRVEAIWDQTITKKSDLFSGTVYSNKEINNAIKTARQGGNPYDIVPSKDDIGHGTNMASIAGARGYDKDVQGVADNCNFVIVKLRESALFRKQVLENNIPYIPVYNTSTIVAGLEYLKNYAISVGKPIIIVTSIGTPDHSHDGSDVFSRYINELASLRGIVLVSGVGNEGAAEGHASGFIDREGDTVTKELNINRDIKYFPFRVWIRRPNIMSLSVISPSGQNTRFIKPKFDKIETFDFIYEETKLKVIFSITENVTGLQVIRLEFDNIKKGVWKIVLRGEYIVGGRFDIWLPPAKTLPEGTRFLEPNPNQTINAAGGARKAISVGYYNQENNSIMLESGRGFPLDGSIKPDLAAPGVNILATSKDETKVAVSGTTAAASIVAGTCALLIEWGIIKGNDPTMYSSKIISYLTAGARRNKNTTYPDRSLGYGTLDLVKVFNNIAGMISDNRNDSGFIEYNINNLFVRIPREMVVK